MTTCYLVTHPEVEIDPELPVPDWPLAPRGVARMRAALERPWTAGLKAVFCSTERKALDAAELLGARLGVEPLVVAALGENDRSATGYLPPEEFQEAADAFFARPDASFRGWETARDAQRRIVVAVDWCLEHAVEGDLALVSHGGVGALLLAHLSGVEISRTLDQPGEGGGNVFAFDAATRALVHGWRPIEGGLAVVSSTEPEQFLPPSSKRRLSSNGRDDGGKNCSGSVLLTTVRGRRPAPRPGARAR